MKSGGIKQSKNLATTITDPNAGMAQSLWELSPQS